MKKPTLFIEVECIIFAATTVIRMLQMHNNQSKTLDKFVTERYDATSPKTQKVHLSLRLLKNQAVFIH